MELDKSVLELIQSNAEFAVGYFSKLVGKPVGFDAYGIGCLSAYIQTMHEKGDKDLYDRIVSVYGSYLGECLVRNFGGKWARVDDTEAIAFPGNGNVAFPFNKLRKHLENGKEAGDSVVGFYEAVGALFAKPRQ